VEPTSKNTKKSQTPSTKLQTNLKFQYQMTKTGLEFGILVPPSADYLFGIWYL